MTYTAQWWNTRAQHRQSSYTPRPAVAPPTWKPAVLPKAAPTVAPPVKTTGDVPSIAKVLRRLKSGARIVDTVDKGYRLSDKGRGKVKKQVFDYLLSNDLIARTFAGIYAPTGKLKTVSA